MQSDGDDRLQRKSHGAEVDLGVIGLQHARVLQRLHPVMTRRRRDTRGLGQCRIGDPRVAGQLPPESRRSRRASTPARPRRGITHPRPFSLVRLHDHFWRESFCSHSSHRRIFVPTETIRPSLPHPARKNPARTKHLHRQHSGNEQMAHSSTSAATRPNGHDHIGGHGDRTSTGGSGGRCSPAAGQPRRAGDHTDGSGRCGPAGRDGGRCATGDRPR